jgi:hypothetical protein
LALNRTENSMSRFFYFHTPSGKSWEVADPVQWCLDNAHWPFLERARDRLLTLTAADRERVIRLVTRRCRLTLIEIQPARVVIHHWGKGGLGDLRSFLKKEALAKQGVEIFLIDRKREVIAVQPGDGFLFGDRLPQDFPLDLYRRKWQRQGEEEPDDAQAAPASWSSFVWAGIEPGQMSWAVLKSVWRKESSPLCPNCEGSTILTGGGRVQCGMFNWRYVLRHACLGCGRQFEENRTADLGGWLVAHLDRPLLPGFEMIWGKPNKWQPALDALATGGPRSGP